MKLMIGTFLWKAAMTALMVLHGQNDSNYNGQKMLVVHGCDYKGIRCAQPKTS